MTAPQDDNQRSKGFLAWFYRWLRITPEPASQNGSSRAPAASVKNLEHEGEVFRRWHDSTGSDKSRQLDDAGFVSEVWYLGREDASLGQGPELGQAVLRSKVELDWLERLSLIKRDIEEKSFKVGVLESEQKSLEHEADQLRQRRWELSAHPALPPDARGRLMALVYVLVALLAFAAEIPLAAALVDTGLQMGNAQVQRISDAATPALIGILCLFGIAFKIFLDSRAHDAPTPSPSESGPHPRRHGRLMLFVMELLVLVMCLGTVGSLGQLRVIADDLRERERQYDDQVKAAGTASVPAAEFSELSDRRAARTTWAGVGLWMLTVTLPMFAALSLFTGTQRIRESNEDVEVHRALQAAERSLDGCRDNLADLRADLAVAHHRLKDETSNPEVKAALLQTRLDVYQHGYGRGRVLPEDRQSAVSLFEIHMLALKRLTSRRIRSAYAAEATGAAGRSFEADHSGGSVS